MYDSKNTVEETIPGFLKHSANNNDDDNGEEVSQLCPSEN